MFFPSRLIKMTDRMKTLFRENKFMLTVEIREIIPASAEAVFSRNALTLAGV